MRMTAVVVTALVLAMAAGADGPYLGDYDAELRVPGGQHVDCERMVQRLKDLGANTYMWLIWHNANDWEDLHEFLPLAKQAGITVWVYLVPHSETAFQDARWPYSEPFKLDYVRWAQEIAKLSLEYDNLIGYVIDDFWGNFNPERFSIEYVREMIEAGRAINPEIKFYPLMYYGQFGLRFVDELAPLIDGCVAAYPRDEGEIERALAYLNDDYLVEAGASFVFPPDQPSQVGEHAFLSQEVTVTDVARASLTLRYEDNFQGPTVGYHTMQVLVDGEPVWEEDVAGPDKGEVTVDLSQALAGKQRARLSVGVTDIKGVGNFRVVVTMSVIAAEGIELVTDLDDQQAWEEDTGGGFSIISRSRREGAGRFHLPLIIMPAGSRGEYAHRHGDEATAELIAGQVRTALGFVADGRAQGVVTYCLNKSEGSEDLEAVADAYRSFEAEDAEGAQQLPGRCSGALRRTGGQCDPTAGGVKRLAELTQDEMVEMAKAYLKSHYNEDTVRMDVLDNTVADGTGELRVECTVRWHGQQSNWRKVFYFENGHIANMRARQI